MGQLDHTVQVTLRNRINIALSSAETEDANSVESQTLRLIKCAMDDRDVIALKPSASNFAITSLSESFERKRMILLQLYSLGMRNVNTSDIMNAQTR